MKQFHVNSRAELLRDLLTGVIIALLSIPLSIGYARTAGLPPEYGLYGSMCAMLVYGLVTGYSRIVFCVDAAPAALVGTLLATLGIAHGGEEAVAIMPVITLVTGLWLLLFWLLKGGKYAKFISETVLGGCVTGIATVVILTQAPLLFGGSTASGRAPTLLAHLFRELDSFNVLSFLMGAVTVAAILLLRNRTKISTSVVMMVLGILFTLLFHPENQGVQLLGSIPAGLPEPATLHNVHLAGHLQEIVIDSLAVALVVAAETLVSTREIARHHGEDLDNQRELLAYALANLAAAIFASSPASGSISRTRRAGKRGVTSQWMSVSGFAVLLLFTLLGAPLLEYLPIPVLAGIVIASLITMLEFGKALRLWRLDRAEFFVFAAAFGAELLGLSEGVIVGLVLTFASFTKRASDQPSYFLGILRGKDGFFDLKRNPFARPIAGTLLYQFNGSLFFATMEDFERDLQSALRPDTKLVVVTGVLSVDVFAAERLVHFYRLLRQRNIQFYLAGHAGAVNEQLIAYGAEELIREGVVRQRLTLALRAGGLSPPYPIQEPEAGEALPQGEDSEGSSALEAFTWAYGRQATARLEDMAKRLAKETAAAGKLDMRKLSRAEREIAGEYWNAADEEGFLDLLQMNLMVESGAGQADTRRTVRKLLERQVELERELYHRGDITAAREFILLRMRREADFLKAHPEAEEPLRAQQAEYMAVLRRKDPGVAMMIAHMREVVTKEQESKVPQRSQ